MKTSSKYNKKALSQMVAYVLLISLALSLSIIVYSWMKYYVNSGKEAPHKEVNLAILNTYCTPTTSQNNIGWIQIDLQNKGRFTINGFSIKATDKPNSRIAVYTLNSTGKELKPGEKYTFQFNFSQTVQGTSPPIKISKVTFIEVQPFTKEGKETTRYTPIYQEVKC